MSIVFDADDDGASPQVDFSIVCEVMTLPLIEWRTAIVVIHKAFVDTGGDDSQFAECTQLERMIA